MLKPVLAMAAGLCVCLSAGAVTLPEVPANGSALEDLDRNVFQCRAADQLTQCRRRGKPSDQIAGESVFEIVLSYRENTLVRTVFTFSEARLDQFVEQLSRQLGAPAAGSEGLKAGMGGVFENRYYVWNRGGKAWFVEQYFERITDSALWMMSDSELDRLFAERERQRVRGARDL
ncbi:MAG: hypothetical protein AMJ66_03835 [Betaproteobacteria bacterium SG8_40]|nr:MAG: hypothetical protein AMJ66_03835 [Betaproteobacteria bacterium SG8_40]